ncbi:MAG: hypothetical protein NZ866_00425 [Patescibacteria group bacterium]|nr:hypothetical protein [Patescibacteria group bacterium]
MIILVTLILDVIIKLLFNKLIFLGLIISLIYFLYSNKYFLISYFTSSLVNDVILILPLGFTGFYFGLILLFFKFLNFFFSLEKDLIILLLMAISIFLFSSFIWYSYFKFNLNLHFFISIFFNLLFIGIIYFIFKNT